MKKSEELRLMTLTEMTNYLDDLSEEQFNLKFQHASKQASNPIRLRTLRREIARVNTIMAEKKKQQAV